MKRLQLVAVRYLSSELVNWKLPDDQRLIVVVAVELNVVLLQLYLLDILYHVLRVLGNLVDRGFYRELVFVHDIVFYRTAEILLISFYCILFLADVLFDDVALRIAGPPLQPLNLGDIEREDRPGNKYLVRLDNAALANFYYIDIHSLLFQRKIDIVDHENFGVGMRNIDNLHRILFGTDNHFLVVDHDHYICIVRIVRILDNVYRSLENLDAVFLLYYLLLRGVKKKHQYVWIFSLYFFLVPNLSFLVGVMENVLPCDHLLYSDLQCNVPGPGKVLKVGESEHRRELLDQQLM